MRRQSSFRIRKRDGRVEWLRSSKLARSIGRALSAVALPAASPGGPTVDLAVDPTGDPGGNPGWHAVTRLSAEPDWRAIDLASAVLTGLCRTRAAGDAGPAWTTDRLSEAVYQVLIATGFPLAATAYVRVRAQRDRRREELHAAMASATGDRPVADRCPDRPSNHRTV